MTARTSSHLRAVAGERKAGESERRVERTTAPKGDMAKAPRPLPAEGRKVWDRIAPELHQRGLLGVENVDVLWTYCVTVSHNVAAANQLTDGRGRPTPLVKGDRGMVKNPAQQIFRDTAATMAQLARVLHLDELGLGRDAGGSKGGAGRLLS